MSAVRAINPQLQAKAIKDLNEVPNQVESDIKHLREWILQQPHLNGRTDDQWLLSFLRFCKFSMQKAKEKIDIYYSLRTILPQMCSNRDPLLPTVQEILKGGVFLPLRKTQSPDAPRTCVARIESIDLSKYSVFDGMKTAIMFFDILFNEDDNLIISGQQVIIDMKGLTMNHVMEGLPFLNEYKKYAHSAQRVYIPQANGYYILNANAVFESFFYLVKPLIKDEHLSKMKFYNADNMHTLTEVVPKDILPKEYGGDGESLAELTTYWKEKLESYRDWFINDEQYCVNESLRQSKAPSGLDFGEDGSFKTLQVD